MGPKKADRLSRGRAHCEVELGKLPQYFRGWQRLGAGHKGGYRWAGRLGRLPTVMQVVAGCQGFEGVAAPWGPGPTGRVKAGR